MTLDRRSNGTFTPGHSPVGGGNTRHGMRRTAEYRVWSNMLNRCQSPKCQMWHRYGGRGISVCERWLRFENFFADMGPRPIGASLDRINNDGNYEPGNCRWATNVQQGSNTSQNRWIECNGETRTISQWAMVVGLTRLTIHKRLQRGWPVRRALGFEP